jgi:hypothetical protein
MVVEAAGQEPRRIRIHRNWAFDRLLRCAGAAGAAARPVRRALPFAAVLGVIIVAVGTDAVWPWLPWGLLD